MSQTQDRRDPDASERAGPPRRPVLFVNPRSGGGVAARAGITQQARSLRVKVVELAEGADLEALVAEAVAGGADLLGMAGGDGSLAIVAAAAARHDLPFVCVPTGTRNHFAIDLGLDRHDPNGAVEALVEGVERRIDVGDVNGRLFLNNVALGVYGDAVDRSAYRDNKVRVLLETVASTLGPGGEIPEITVVGTTGAERLRPSIVLVSNNPYDVDPRTAPRMRTLDGGRLGVVIVPAAPGLRSGPRAWTASTIRIEARAPLRAGIDGEAATLTPPLTFTIRPAALRVRTQRG